MTLLTARCTWCVALAAHRCGDPSRDPPTPPPQKGFPVDAKLDDLIEFANGIAPTARVSMRRFKDEVKTFKGSVFVEFAGKEGADKAVAAGASEEGLTFAGTKLEKVLKRGDYLAEKKAARAKVTETPAFKRELIPGVIVKLEGLDATASWSTIQEAARALAGVRFTEIDSATNTAHLRCLTPDDAAKVLAAVAKTAEAEKAAAGSADTTTPEGCLDIAKLGGKVPTATLLEGDEERAYWEKVWAAQAERFKANAAHRGGRKGGRKRPRDAAPPSADAAAAAAAAAAGTAASAEAPSAAKKPAVE